MEVKLDINYADGSVKVAPLIFMAFVENAFKYASRDDKSINRIVISLKQQPGKIDFVCENTYDEGEFSPGGIGLNNATRRLELLYKDHYRLDIKNENNVYRVQLTLTL
jgi:LytS/YehU family sensor histidine kinase